jgi:hypothetical protein
MHYEGGYDRHTTCGAYDFRDCLGVKDLVEGVQDRCFYGRS